MSDDKITFPTTYFPALEHITSLTGKLNAIGNQFNFLNLPNFQSGLTSAIDSFQHQLVGFNTINLQLPDISKSVGQFLSIESSRQATLAISGLSSMEKLFEPARLVTENFGTWYQETIAKSSILSSDAFGKLNIPDLSGSFSKLLGSDKSSTLTLQSSLLKSAELAVLAEKSLYNISIDNIGSKLPLLGGQKDILSASMIGLSETFSNLFKSFEGDPKSYALISPSLSKITPIEYFSTANLLETISIEEDITAEEELLKNEIQYENEISLRTYLPKIDPGLYNMWKGAIEAFHSDNTDRVRHFSASIRELFTHLIHKIAPDDSIKSWTNDDTFYHQGRPTRKARFLYICRNINNGSFNEFVKKDVEAMLAFMGVFQQGTHDIDPAFTPKQLLTIKSKAETTLKFLLEIQFSTNQ